MLGGDTRLGEAVQVYLDTLTYEQCARRATRLGYQSSLRRFNRYIAERYGREPRLRSPRGRRARSIAAGCLARSASG